MKFNIINPSDPYTMEAPDLEVAAVAVSFLGNGAYPLDGIGESAGQNVPPFLIGGHDEWFIEKFGKNFEGIADDMMNSRSEELAAAFDSVTLESKRRSSMNDIKARAQSLSNSVRIQASRNQAAKETTQ